MAGDSRGSSGINRFFGFRGFHTISRALLTQLTSAGNAGEKPENAEAGFQKFSHLLSRRDGKRERRISCVWTPALPLLLLSETKRTPKETENDVGSP